MLESALIAHGSPTLARLKTGSLFSVRFGSLLDLQQEMVRVNSVLTPRGVQLIRLHCSSDRALMYLYRVQALRETLLRPDIQTLLSVYGYQSFSTGAALATLAGRLSSSRDFPHEIGVFLGYPLEDVVGFIRNGGRDCLCAGCWKAYANECEARRTFARLRKCRDVYMRLFAEGYSLARLTVRTSAPSSSDPPRGQYQ